jgi:Tfp pilus assembly protein PilP
MARLPRVRSLLALLIVGPSILFSAAPSPGAQEAQKEVSSKESRPTNKPPEAAKEGTESTPVRYVYNPTGKTDPFKPFIAEQEAIEEQKVRKPKTYLETLDLSQLELIAIVVGSKGNYAMVRDSKGVGHVIQKGTAIGTNDGSVYAVTEREIIVREEYKDFRGTVQSRDIAKRFPTLQQ